MGEETQKQTLDLTVIVPLGPRYEDLHMLCKQLKQVLEPLGKSYEVLFIDDATGPATQRKVEAVKAQHPEVRYIRLQREMGESTALGVGSRLAKGNIFITIDPYLHVAIEDVPKILEPIDQGHDLVCAWRHPRQESGLGYLASEAFNSIARWMTKIDVHDLNCRVRAMRRDMLEELPIYGDMYRFLPIFAVRRGYQWCEVKVPQQPGKKEIGAFDIRSYVRRCFDLLSLAFLTRFVKRPLHFFGVFGVASFSIGILISAYLTYDKFVLGAGIGHRPLLLLAVLLLVVGLQIGSIGLLGELLIFTHARDIKDYVVEED